MSTVCTLVACLLTAGAFLSNIPRAEAETVTAVTLDSSVAVFRSNDEAAATALTKGSLDVHATGNRNVRAMLRMDATVGDGLYFNVSRAYTTVRLPWFRFMVGKNRVSFGHGFLFDAGDVIFGGLSMGAVDLSASVLRDDTTWLAEFYLPLGSFSYAEAVFLPYLGPAGVFSSQSSGSVVQDVRLLALPVGGDTLSAGGRLAGRLGNVDMEAGYLYNGSGGLHVPYVSAAGNLGVNWYASVSATIPAADADWAHAGDRVAATAGFFSVLRPARETTLSIRFEAAVIPAGHWTEVASGITPLSSTTASTSAASWPAAAEVNASFTSRYGVYLFPEVDLAPSKNLTLQLRSLVSPIDLSATIIGGAAWTVYQGLTLQGFLFVMAGDSTDTYGWGRTGGVGLLLGTQFVY